jgi:hypothetical protein
VGSDSARRASRIWQRSCNCILLFIDERAVMAIDARMARLFYGCQILTAADYNCRFEAKAIRLSTYKGEKAADEKDRWHYHQA